MPTVLPEPIEDKRDLIPRSIRMLKERALRVNQVEHYTSRLMPNIY